MNFAEEHRVIETFFTQNWNSATCPVQYENIQATQPKNAIWGRLNILNGKTEPAALGLMKIRTPGVIVLQLFAPSYDGVRKLRELADDFSRIFNGQYLQLAKGIIRFNVVGIKPLGLQNGWYQINAEVDFQHDEDEEIIVIQNNQFEVALSHVGVAVDEMVFGRFEPTRSCLVVAATAEAQDTPVGSNLIFDLVDGSGEEKNRIFSLSPGQSSSKTVFASPLAIATGGRISIKTKQVGSGYAGQNLHIKLLCVNQ